MNICRLDSCDIMEIHYAHEPKKRGRKPRARPTQKRVVSAEERNHFVRWAKKAKVGHNCIVCRPGEACMTCHGRGFLTNTTAFLANRDYEILARAKFGE